MQAVRDIMTARMALAAQKGCDGVEPDNVQVMNEKWKLTWRVSVLCCVVL